MTDLKIDRPDSTPDELPSPEYETLDARVDRRSFLTRMGALGAAGVALAQLPPVRARAAGYSGSSMPKVAVRPEVLADPTEATIAEATTLIARKQLTPSELTEAYLERIRLYDTDYWQAYYTVLADESRAAAAQLDRASKPVGLLHGVSVPVKDNFYTKGILTTAQSLIFADFVPDVDATAVARIKAAGGIILGKRSPAVARATRRRARSRRAMPGRPTIRARPRPGPRAARAPARRRGWRPARSVHRPAARSPARVSPTASRR
jgi:hypothetical protein